MTSRSKTSSSEDTPERLMAAATRLFAERGFDGTSVKDLADAAGVNVSLVSYHFGGKENLYRTCLEQFGRERLAVAQRVLQPSASPEEFRLRLRMYVDELLASHGEDAERARIIHRECDMESPIAQDVFRDTVLKSYETLVGFIQSAQERGIVRRDLDCQVMTGVLFGSILQFMRMDRISEKFFGKTIKNEAYRQLVAEHLVELGLHGLLTQGGAP